MLKIKIIPVGKLKEKFYIDACKELIFEELFKFFVNILS